MSLVVGSDALVRDAGDRVSSDLHLVVVGQLSHADINALILCELKKSVT